MAVGGYHTVENFMHFLYISLFACVLIIPTVLDWFEWRKKCIWICVATSCCHHRKEKTFLFFFLETVMEKKKLFSHTFTQAPTPTHEGTHTQPTTKKKQQKNKLGAGLLSGQGQSWVQIQVCSLPSFLLPSILFSESWPLGMQLFYPW